MAELTNVVPARRFQLDVCSPAHKFAATLGASSNRSALLSEARSETGPQRLQSSVGPVHASVRPNADAGGLEYWAADPFGGCVGTFLASSGCAVGV